LKQTLDQGEAETIAVVLAKKDFVLIVGANPDPVKVFTLF
jgi:predicted nucleic acid-binding protein